MFQWFFSASAIAGAAAFLAFSRLIGAPYGFGICANALANTPATNNAAMVNLTAVFCTMMISPILSSDELETGTLDQRGSIPQSFLEMKGGCGLWLAKL